jgi:DNA-binding response OmpR family regulator
MDKKKVLLVDDDHDIISALEAILSSKGYKVFTAMNKREGLEKLQNQTPDIAILDVMMDDEHDGFDMSREIKKTHPNLPIIMLTGISEITGVNFRAAAADPEWLPADDFLDKPVNPDILITTIENLLIKGT